MAETTQDNRPYSLLDDETRECPFAYFKHLRQNAPVSFMPEI